MGCVKVFTPVITLSKIHLIITENRLSYYTTKTKPDAATPTGEPQHPNTLPG